MREDSDFDPVHPTGQRTTAWAQHGVPEDAQRMGLDRHTVEGSLVAMAGSLSNAKRKHRVIAWALLVVFAAPPVLTLLGWLGWW